MAGVTRRPATRRRRDGRAGRVVGALVALGLLAVLFVPAVIAARVVQVADRDDRVAADAIVVLGASQLDGRPGGVLEARLEHALGLFREGLAPLVVTTGGNQEGDRFTEADSARDWLIDNGVPADAVVAVPTGQDTYESLVPVAVLAREQGWSGVLVVSDPWHVYRVRTMADDLDLPVAGTSPTRTGPSNEVATRVVSYVVRETGGVVVHHGSVLVERLAGLGS
jgi:uncharacterized SAM-binding protein YcdF (DUF218 family)